MPKGRKSEREREREQASEPEPDVGQILELSGREFKITMSYIYI